MCQFVELLKLLSKFNISFNNSHSVLLVRADDLYIFALFRRAKILVNQVIEDAGGATSLPVSYV